MFQPRDADRRPRPAGARGRPPRRARGQPILPRLPTHHQPADTDVTGVEALLRWRHPTRGVVQPDAFIPMLEDTGMIIDVGRWVLNEACRQTAAWHAKGHPPGHLGQRLGPPTRHRRPSRRRRRRRSPPRARPGLAHHRDHRDDHHARRRGHRPALKAIKAARRAHRHRRLRHRLQLARLPEPVPRRHPEDRPVVHLGHRRHRPKPRPSSTPWSSSARASGLETRRRRHRGGGPVRPCRASIATAARASSSPGRSKPPRSRTFSPTPTRSASRGRCCRWPRGPAGEGERLTLVAPRHEVDHATRTSISSVALCSALRSSRGPKRQR